MQSKDYRRVTPPIPVKPYRLPPNVFDKGYRVFEAKVSHEQFQHSAKANKWPVGAKHNWRTDCVMVKV